MSGSPRYDAFAVEVAGGTLHVGRWGTGRAPVVVAAHGVTATHRSFRALAEQLGDQVTVLAPDLRGRGRSNGVTGPFSMAAVIGPALQRLRMTFPSTAAYLDYWRQHPALAGDWNAYCEDAYTYDLEGEEPALRSGVREAAVLADADSQLLRDDIPAALRALRHPALLLRAPAGMLGAQPGLYPDAWLAGWQGRVAGLRSVLVPDVNHYTILLTERGARAVARQVREELGLAASGADPTRPGEGGAGARPA
jgi:pimeloyl-ACP methyl ester carboxylesterase